MSVSEARAWQPDDEFGIRELVRRNRLPITLIRLEDRRIVEVSEPMASALGGRRELLLQRDLADFVAERETARSRLALLASGEVDGYRVLRREYRRLDGTTFTGDGWVSACTDETPRRLAVVVIMPVDEATPGRDLRLANARSDVVVLGTVDGSWRIDRISADVEQLLGYGAADVIGRSLADLVQPADLPCILIALGHGLRTSGGTTARLHLRSADGKWLLCRAMITPLADPTGSGLGFAFSLSGLAVTDEVADRVRELEDRLRRIVRELADTGLVARISAMPTARELPALAALSGQELKIVARLNAGERVPMIARQLFLSQSTVRNHLASVYRKLGVRSQQELLTLLRGDADRRSAD
jgi:PAS domain S-box-containing protein